MILLKKFQLSLYSQEILNYCTTLNNLVRSIYLLLYLQVFLWTIILWTFLGSVFQFELWTCLGISLIFSLFYLYVLKLGLEKFVQLTTLKSLNITLIVYYILTFVQGLMINLMVFKTEILFQQLKGLTKLEISNLQQITHYMFSYFQLIFQEDNRMIYIYGLSLVQLFLFIFHVLPFIMVYQNKNSIYFKLKTNYERFTESI